MSTNVLTIAAIAVVAICSFGFLADVMLADWRALGKTKGAPFSKLNKKGLSHGLKPGLGCFAACMKRFAWNVDEASPCASKCKA
jgi:hypothetical protein